MSTLQSLNTTRMRDLVTCSICLEVLQDPKVLQCLHSFCAHCLEGIGSAYQLAPHRHPITCPVCQNISQLPVKGVQGLPNDFKVEQMKDFLEVGGLGLEGYGWGGKMEGSIAVCEVCRGNESGIPPLAKVHCGQCCVFYCQKCVLKHNANALFRHHNVTHLTIIPTAGTNAFCAQHPGHRVHFLCPTCHHQNATMCAICVLDHDVTHDVCDVTSAVKSLRMNLRTNHNAVKAKIDLLRKQKEEMADMRCAHEHNLCEIKEAICLQTLLIIAQIDDIKARMLNEVDEMGGSLLANIKEDQVNFHLLELVKVEAELEKALLGSNERCLADYKKITDQVQKLQTINILDFPPEKCIEFLPNRNMIDSDIIGTLIYIPKIADRINYVDQRRNAIVKTEHSEMITNGPYKIRNTITVSGKRGKKPSSTGVIEQGCTSNKNNIVRRKSDQRTSGRWKNDQQTSGRWKSDQWASGSTSAGGFSSDGYTNRGFRWSKGSSLKSSIAEGSITKECIPSTSIMSSTSASSKQSSVNGSSSTKRSSADGSFAEGPSMKRCSSSGCSNRGLTESHCEACNNRSAVISFYNMKKERIEKLCRHCRALTDVNTDR